jgi:hypothetical protein
MPYLERSTFCESGRTGLQQYYTCTATETRVSLTRRQAPVGPGSAPRDRRSLRFIALRQTSNSSSAVRGGLLTRIGRSRRQRAA